MVVFGNLTWAQQSNFGTFGFDMGIYDQGIWLLSRFREPFVTVRGLNYFGHHVNPITLLFVPAYWLGAGPHFLYLVETAWMAAGAVPIYLLARDELGDRRLAAILGCCYLLYPSLEWMNWWHFHPDTLMIAPLLLAWWFATRAGRTGPSVDAAGGGRATLRRWAPFGAAVAVALLCKEDAGLAVVVLGLLVAWRWDRRVGLGTAAAGAVWFVLCSKVIIPRANGGLAPLYAELFPGFGNNVVEIAWNMVRHPSRIWSAATAGGMRSPRTYYWQMLAPVAFLPFLAPLVLLIGGPQTVINVVSAHSYTHDFKYHYSSIVTAAIFLATVEGIARVHRSRRWPAAAPVLVACVAVATLAANVAWSPSPIGGEFDSGMWVRHPLPQHAAANRALDLVPARAGVAATYWLVPHLTHRSHIYEWPNPFIATNWGVTGSRPPDPATVDWLVLDRRTLGTSQPLLDQLTGSGGSFTVIYESDDIVVARRV